jgi:hypothetical protein
MGNLLGDAWLSGWTATTVKIALDNLSACPGSTNWIRSRAGHAIATAVYRNLGQILFEIGWSLAVDIGVR